MPWRSGFPSGVRGGVHAFPAVVAFAADDGACPAAGACVSRTIRTTAASAAVEARKRRPMGPPFVTTFVEADLQVRLLVAGLLPKRTVHQLFRELHALVFQEPCVLLDVPIQRHADLPGS